MKGPKPFVIHVEKNLVKISSEKLLSKLQGELGQQE